MSTRRVIEEYFRALVGREDWQAFLADDLRFTSMTSPVKRLSGKTAYLEATRGFFSMVRSVQLRDLLVDGARACALTHYELQGPGGNRFESDVAEIFTVRDNQIATFDIYFDSAPFPK